MGARGRQLRPDLNERLSQAIERFIDATDTEGRHVVNLARRFGVSHTTLRKELRAMGYLPPQRKRQAKHDDPNQTDCGPACTGCSENLKSEIEQSETWEQQKREGGF